MNKHNRRRIGGRKLLLQAALMIICLCVTVPLCFLAFVSLQSGIGGGYVALFSADNPLWIAYRNSLYVCTLSLTGQLVTSILGGWGLAKYQFPGRGVLLFSCVILMMLPVQAVLLPQYLLLRSLGLLDTLWALILPGMFSPLGTVLLWHGFSKFPNEIVEAAASEGAGWFVTLWRIVLPECKRELSVLILVSLADSWNLLEQPMAYIKTTENYPLSVYLSTAAISDLSQRAAACIAALIPIFVIFLLLVRFVIPDRVKGVVENG